MSHGHPRRCSPGSHVPRTPVPVSVVVAVPVIPAVLFALAGVALLDGVRAGASADGVRARPALDQVVARVAVDLVLAALALDVVVAEVERAELGVAVAAATGTSQKDS